MTTWETMFEWGRRASDRATSAPAEPRPDRLLESVIAHEQIEVLYQPLIEPRTGRIVGAEALARSTMATSGEALFKRATAAGLDERLSRLVQRKALRCAAVWEGPLKDLKISINLLPQDLARELGLQVVIEGVESTGQLALLADWGCDLYQGFLGAGALSHEELTRFVAAAQVEAA